MSKYSFTFKKGNIFVDFSTTDKEFVEKQFQIWVNAADNYAKKMLKKPVEPIAPRQITPKPEVQPEIFDKASEMLKTINSIQTPMEEKPAQSAEPKGFEEILEKSIEKPSFEPVRNHDAVFLNFIKSKNTTDKFHYLIITAYYLSEFEKMERFSLKQINSKLMQNLSEVIDHATLQSAIGQNFIELVPDLTGTSEIGEYRLTREGEDFFANRI